ncbi:MAG: Ig-like domain-containing protein, partial [Clostridia bacterium]|nr:Ig-like domain-containing protein [Clostridia bacterium]
MQEIVEELRKDEYTIKEVEISGNEITGIKLSRESMTLGFESSNTIKVILESSSEPYAYYVLVEGKYYKMNFNGGVVTIDRTPSDISGEEGEKITLTVTSENEEIATAVVDNDTKTVSVTAKNTEGTVVVTVTYGNFSKTCNVTVKDIPISTAMELNSVRARIAAGYTRWLAAMTTPSDALQEFEWSSSDTEIATVDNKGVVTAKKAGTATIKAKTIDGSNKEG